MRKSSPDSVERVASHWLNRDAVCRYREHCWYERGTIFVFARGASDSEHTFHHAAPRKRDELFRPERDDRHRPTRPVFSDGECARCATTRADREDHRHIGWPGLVAFDGNVRGDRSVIESDLDSRDVNEELDVAFLPEDTIRAANSRGGAKAEADDAPRCVVIELDRLGDAARGEWLLRQESRTLTSHYRQQSRTLRIYCATFRGSADLATDERC